MKLSHKFFLILVLTPLFSLSSLKANTDFNYNFSKGHDGWVADFADYPIGEEAFFELNWGWANLPHPLHENHKGMFLSGNNHSDDLLMFIKRQVDGLKPNTEYDLMFTVTIESNVPVGQMGVGGSPGESVFFKVGASAQEPIKQIEGNYYRLNIDIGSQSNGGNDGIVIGDLANPAVNLKDLSYMPKEMYSPQSFKSMTDDNGRLWLLVGTDSGFEATSHYYIAKISVKATISSMEN
ncbi:MAG: hypothetical protein H0T62_07635 [Parachlamydiaceae bacterium]|nr:hypothetical protein [Parachlamydiaceae bacterium]